MIPLSLVHSAVLALALWNVIVEALAVIVWGRLDDQVKLRLTIAGSVSLVALAILAAGAK